MRVMGDWAAPPDPSPRTLMSNFLNEEFGSKSFSDIWADTGMERSLPAFEENKMCMNSKEECSHDGFNFSSNISFDGQKSSSLAQRIARTGFNAPKINTSTIKGSSPSEVRSPYLTIPPGLSPTTLLDSPVFLSNSMAQPSPTTGKISFLNNCSSSFSISASDSAVLDRSKDDHPEDFAYGGFAFKPHLNSTSSYFSNLENKDSSSINHQQKDFNLPAGVLESSERKDYASDIAICAKPTDSFVSNENSPPLEDLLDGGDTKGEFSSVAVAAPAEDGYNWRKYGQKQVKGSEFPRSYYKCTHPSCQVKKKIERSHEGHITEIIYKGAHNHAKPMANRRSGVPLANAFNDAQTDGIERPGSQANFEGRPLTWAGDRMDMSSASLAAGFADPSISVQNQDQSHLESPEAIDVSSTVSNEEEEEDQATRGSVSLGVDAEGDESESKRRKLDASAVEMNTGSRAVREPRVVVQTTSEVDILDDGYRWRKYGQKVVKGNPNPRSYYKCTNPGCTVRKHVERASHDLKSVITTYEGKHNHDVPAARNSSHSSSGPSTTATSQSAQAHSLHRRPDPTQDSYFNGPPPSFNLPGRDQKLGLQGGGFSFGMMGHPGLANLGMGGLGPMGLGLGPVHSYMGQQGNNVTAGFTVPKAEPEEAAVSSNGMAAYHQLLSRLPLGPQM